MINRTTSPPWLELPEITGRGAHLLIWFYYATISMLALLALDDVRSPAIVYASVGIFGVVWFVLTQDSAVRASTGVCVAVITGCVLTALLSSGNSITGGFSQWYVGAGALAMFYLSLRGRNLLAWIGFSAIAVVMVGWGLSTDDRLLEAIILVARQAPFVLVGSLFSVGIRRTGKKLEGVHRAETARVAAEAAALARTTERQRRLWALDSAVGSHLRRIANGVELTDDDRRELLVAEARLRDSLRARQLDLPEMIASTERARHRGVTVLLLDDCSPAVVASEALSRVRDPAIRMLDAAVDGTVTIRLLPAGRPLVATLVADGAEYSRVEVASPTPKGPSSQ